MVMRVNSTNIEYFIKKRLKEFEQLGKIKYTIFDFSPFLDLKLKANLKTELAFCISTANSSAISGLKFQKILENYDLSKISVGELESLLRRAGVRFHAKKAKYIKSVFENFDIVKEALNIEKSEVAREYLVKNIKGLGYKEASHFLRNVGRKDVAIIDRHILRWLYENNLINYPTITPSRYKKIEKILMNIASEQNKSLAELDLYLWYFKTGKILK
ncbi:MAG TPA: N-glycosylase/DNA lyase [Archaeoglobus profundus]|nr:N-glycosylase/DNA lyase [Archaeoglobus profundus]